MSSVPLCACARAISRVAVLAGLLLLASSCGGDGKCIADLCITEQRIGLDIALSSTSTGSGRVDATYPEGHSCQLAAGSTGNHQCHTSFNDAGAGGQVFLTATPDPGSAFAGWSGCTSVSGNQCTLTFSAASGDTTLSAVVVFVIPSNLIRLTVSAAGAGAGHVDVDQNVGAFPSFDCDFPSASACSREYRNSAGSGIVDLEASPTSGSVFVSWTGCTPYPTRPQRCHVNYPAPPADTDFAVTVRFDVVAAACTSPLTIQDQFDSDAGWTATAITSGGSPTQSVSFQATGGNPGGYRQMQHVFTGASAIAVYHYYGTTTYDPGAQGAIDHINYFEDQIELNPPSPGAAVGTGFSMMQGGTRYNIILRPPGGAFTNTAWETTLRVNLTAAAFPGVNFSSTGGPITFGYFRSNTNTGGGAVTLTHGIDNWRVEICR